MNFQYAVDLLCGSTNRQCDYKKLFNFIGVENPQTALRIDFRFVNGSTYDPELNRTFHPQQGSMFRCDQPVFLPHISKQKCNCMVCKTKTDFILILEIYRIVRKFYYSRKNKLSLGIWILVLL